jgi:hypothetical protein
MKGDKASITIRTGIDEQTFDFEQREDGTWQIDLDMTEPEALAGILKTAPGVLAGFASEGHWPVYRFIGRDVFDLLPVLRAWSVL